MWQRATALRLRPRRRGGRPAPAGHTVRTGLALAALAALLLLLLLRGVPSSQPSYRLRVRVRPAASAPGAAAPAAPSGNSSYWEEEWAAAERSVPDALHDTAQGPGSAQWRAQQAGVEHLLAAMAAAGAALPAYDGAAAARERAAFAPRSWVAAAGDLEIRNTRRSARGALRPGQGAGDDAGAGGRRGARRRRSACACCAWTPRPRCTGPSWTCPRWTSRTRPRAGAPPGTGSAYA